MCGFAGVLRLTDGCPPIDPAVLGAMGRSLAHRGPDGAGYTWDRHCGLCHCRLSIIDLSEAGAQPMANEAEDVWLVYNGELYNFEALKREFVLPRRGRPFRSRTDTEVILRLYEELGIECVERFNGMYALAVWDARTETLHLARDPFGIKPLFYRLTPHALWFASEIKALLVAPDCSREPSLQALHHFLSLNYIPGSLTAFEGITELRPGTCLTARAGRPPRQWCAAARPDPVPGAARSEAEAVEGVRAHLRAAVERQLIGDVPIGVMLSGGLDSSALTQTMAMVRGRADFHTFSLAFDDRSFDESAAARQVAAHVGTRHHEIRVAPAAVAALLPEFLRYIDEPYGDGSAIPTYLLAQAAKEHVKVLLSGEGGDELFLGYATYAAYRARSLYRRLPAWVRHGIIRPAASLLPVSHDKLSFDFKAKRFVRGAELEVPRAHLFWRVVLDEDAKREVLAASDVFRGFAGSAELYVDAYQEAGPGDELSRLAEIDFRYHLPDDLMVKNDRMTMAHSIEARVPFTDPELVRYVRALPSAMRMRGLRTKHLLRASLRGQLPREILERPKVGLEMPYSRWLTAELRELAESLLSPGSVSASGLFDRAAVQRLWTDHLARRVDHGRALWGLVNYLLWHRTYIQNSGAQWPVPAMSDHVGREALLLRRNGKTLCQ